MQLTKDFTYEEMKCKCPGWCDGGKMVPDFMESLQKLRDLCGFPLKINSGYRCPKWNDYVGGEPHSMHMLGMAADIAIHDSMGTMGFLIVYFARSAGFNGVGIDSNFVHVDTRGTFSMWGYGADRTTFQLGIPHGT